MSYDYSEKPLNLGEHYEEVPAGTLNVGDEIFVQHNILLSQSPIENLFIPDFIDCDSYWIGLKRDHYKKFAYRTSETTSDLFVNLVNKKFKYSKTSKMYKTLWKTLSSKEKLEIKNIF